MTTVTRPRLDERPTKGHLTIPYMVDESRDPIDFKAVDPEHVKRCATARRCGVCGGKIRSAPFAFIGPADRAYRLGGQESCFADPWMHPDCVERAMQQCPFLAGRRGWRDPSASLDPLINHHAYNMVLVVAQDCQSHKDHLGAWHFQALGELAYPDQPA